MDKTVIAALIGAVAALVTIVVRDILIASAKEKAELRRTARKTKLEKIYSPLMAWMG